MLSPACAEAAQRNVYGQTLACGHEPLIGTSDSNNFGRTFGAAKLHSEQSKFSIDVFSSTAVYILRDLFDYSDLFNVAGTQVIRYSVQYTGARRQSLPNVFVEGRVPIIRSFDGPQIQKS